jgi:hypothetical protein
VSFVAKYAETTGEKIRSIQRIEKRRKTAQSVAAPVPVEFEVRRGEITIDRTHPLVQALFRKRKYAPLVEKILVAFERANQESGATKRRELFYKLLIEIFADL